MICVVGNKLDTREVLLKPVSGSTDQYEASFFLGRPAGERWTALMYRKDHAFEELIHAIRSALDGRRYFGIGVTASN